MKKPGIAFLVLALLWVTPGATAKGDDFGQVVKVIERFYQVKHKSLPFLAKAGIKTAAAAARIAGGYPKRLAEAGSVKIAFFEDQDFSAKGQATSLRSLLKTTLVPDWLPFVQVLSPRDDEQTYVFLRDAGDKFKVLVVTIEKHDATVVQVTVSRSTLAMLMQNPNEMGKAITDDALSNEDQE